MQLKLTVRTPRGWYAEARTEGRNISEVISKVMHLLGEMPAKQRGDKFLDWSTLEIVITRENS